MPRHAIAAVASLIAFAAGPAVADTPPGITIVLSNFRFTPSEIRLKAGQPVLIHLVNQGSGGHNFSAPQFFAAASMDASQRRALHKGTAELAKGASLDLLLTPAAGRFELRCSHFLHSGFGMTGSIVVE